MEFDQIYLTDIDVGQNRRAVDPDKIRDLMGSMRAIGLQTPISVWDPRDDSGIVHLIAGRHRLEAAKLLGWEQIDCIVVKLDETERRMWEISENLHRAELTALERAEHISEWVRLVDEKKGAQVAPSGNLQSGQNAQNESKRTDGRGHRHEGGLSAATRELGIERTDARRAIKVDALPPEVKETARILNLDDNRSALLKAAKEPDIDSQKAALQNHAAAKAKQSPAPDPLNNFETTERQVKALMAAWNKAGPEARERFMDRIDRPVADNTRAASR